MRAVVSTTITLLVSLLIGSQVGCNKESSASWSRPGQQDATAAALAEYDAEIGPNWKITGRTTQTANSSQQFADLQQQYPQYLGAIDPTTVSAAILVQSDYLYVGANTCPPNDARLFYTNIFFQACGTVGAKLTCETPDMPVPSPHDPCLAGTTAP